MGSFSMIFSRHVQTNTVYYCFLKGVLYLIQHLPDTYGKYILISAKQFIALLPVLYLAVSSLVALFIHYKVGKSFAYKRLSQKQHEFVDIRQKLTEDEDERAIMKRSTELLMDCVRTLEEKLETEIVTRKVQQKESDKERSVQIKKIQSIEAKVDKLRSNLKQGMIGMDKVLQNLNRKSSGDNKENAIIDSNRMPAKI